LRKYLFITRNSMMASLTYRAHSLVMLLSNAVYIVVVYFLWKAIYGGSSAINGMSFTDAFLYLSMAMSIFILMQCWTEWSMSNNILNGNIVVSLIRPMDYQVQLFFDQAGFMLINMLTTTLPSTLILVLAFHAPLHLGLNLALFLLALLLGFAISFCIDYLTGLFGFYTESIWGISMTKEVIVLLLSGALVPFAFFPEAIRQVLVWLPFQAIYNIPLRILLEPRLGAPELLSLLGVQAAWIAVLVLLSRLAFMRASRALTVNGG
jgi:ABC-2 type transport system permease protein